MHRHSLTNCTLASLPDFHPGFTFVPVEVAPQPSQYQPQVSPIFVNNPSLLSKRLNPYELQDPLMKKSRHQNHFSLQPIHQTSNEYNCQNILIAGGPSFNNLMPSFYTPLPQVSLPQLQLIELPIFVNPQLNIVPVQEIHIPPNVLCAQPNPIAQQHIAPMQSNPIHTGVIFQDFFVQPIHVPPSVLQTSLPVNWTYPTQSNGHLPVVSTCQETCGNSEAIFNSNNINAQNPILEAREQDETFTKENDRLKPQDENIEKTFSTNQSQSTSEEKNSFTNPNEGNSDNLSSAEILTIEQSDETSESEETNRKENICLNENEDFVIRIRKRIWPKRFHKSDEAQNKFTLYIGESGQGRKKQFGRSQVKSLNQNRKGKWDQSLREGDNREIVNMLCGPGYQAEIPSLEGKYVPRKILKLKWSPEIVSDESLIKLLEELKQYLGIPVNEEKAIRLLMENENNSENVIKLVQNDLRKYIKFFTVIKKKVKRSR